MSKHLLILILSGTLAWGTFSFSAPVSAAVPLANKQGGAKTRLPNTLHKGKKGEQPAAPQTALV